MFQSINRFFYYVTRHLDGPLMVCVTLLVALGLAVIYSSVGGNTIDRPIGQLRNFGVALVAMWLIANIAPQALLRLAVPIYVFGLVLLIGVALFGDIRNGARRWLNIGVTTIQPSEIMKIGMPMILAWYFHKKEEGLRAVDYAVAALLLAIPTGLIMRQPDLGTSILIFSSGFFVIFLAGLSWRILISLGVAGLACLPFAWNMLHDYQRQRILTLLDPTTDPLGAGYHIALYLIVIARGMMIAFNAPNIFSRLLAGAVTLTFATYAIVNIGMVSGLLPVVGVPLPLISYGGTAMLSMLIGFGILMSISTHKQLVSS
jgi:rod shape determining protein RodA